MREGSYEHLGELTDVAYIHNTTKEEGAVLDVNVLPLRPVTVEELDTQIAVGRHDVIVEQDAGAGTHWTDDDSVVKEKEE